MKVSGPLMSFSASGKFGARLVFSVRASGQQARLQKAQKNVPSALQLAVRANYTLAYQAWNALSPTAKAPYILQAKNLHMTGFNLFMQGFVPAPVVYPYLYMGGYGANLAKQMQKSGFSFLGDTPSYGGTIFAMCRDSNSFWVGGMGSYYVSQYDNITLAHVQDSLSYGSAIRCLLQDSTYIYVAGSSPYTVKKLNKSDLSISTFSSSYGGDIRAMDQDSTHIYAGGAYNNVVEKYLKSSMATVATSSSFGDIINVLCVDNNYVYVGCFSLNKITKLDKTTLAFVADVTGNLNDVYCMGQDSTYLYVGASYSGKLRRYLKSTLAFVDESANLGSAIGALLVDEVGGHVYVNSGNTQYQLLLSDLSTVASYSGYGNNVFAFA